MTDGEIRFVVAKNLCSGTDWAISSPFTHSVGTNQFNTKLMSFVRYRSYRGTTSNPENAWSVGNVGTQLATPYPGDAVLAGFRLSAAGISTNNTQAAVFGARSFSFSGKVDDENDNLVVDADPQTAWNETGGNGVQFRAFRLAFEYEDL